MSNHFEISPPETRRVVVIGANPITENLGHTIAVRLRSDFVRDGAVVEMSPSWSDTYLPMDTDLTGVDTLVLCNGSVRTSDIDKMHENDIHKIVEDNLTDTMTWVRTFVQDTSKYDDGVRRSIVMMGSMAHRKVLSGMSVYCAAKAGLDMFAKCMAWELAPKGYDVFVVHPSSIENTPMADDIIAQMQDFKGIDAGAARSAWEKSFVRPDFLTAEEIAETVSFLVSGKASQASGTSIEMAGGQR